MTRNLRVVVYIASAYLSYEYASAQSKGVRCATSSELESVRAADGGVAEVCIDANPCAPNSQCMIKCANEHPGNCSKPIILPYTLTSSPVLGFKQLPSAPCVDEPMCTYRLPSVMACSD